MIFFLGKATRKRSTQGYHIKAIYNYIQPGLTSQSITLLLKRYFRINICNLRDKYLKIFGIQPINVAFSLDSGCSGVTNSNMLNGIVRLYSECLKFLNNLLFFKFHVVKLSSTNISL